jgi:site-specific DNA-methyltransferase (adenine-specific)
MKIEINKQNDLGQWMTPVWAAESLVSTLDLRDTDRVLEPTCGTGNFLKAIPQSVTAVGIEIDPELAEVARRDTGREVITGDFREVELPWQPTVVLGNPPYKVDLISDLLEKSYELLPPQGKVALLISVHILQTPDTVDRLLGKWGISHHLVPRTLFPRAIRPLSYIVLTKGSNHCHGMLLYPESLTINRLPRAAKTVANNGQGSVWLRVVVWAMDQTGGEATLSVLYDLVGANRPTPNQFWKDKIRQVLQQHFVPVARGRWATKEKAKHGQNSQGKPISVGVGSTQPTSV